MIVFMLVSSYLLVMIAFDRFQAVCHPMTNRHWQPRKSNFKIGVAWIIALLLCIPQALIFGLVEDIEKSTSTCSVNVFVKGGKLYSHQL